MKQASRIFLMRTIRNKRLSVIANDSQLECRLTILIVLLAVFLVVSAPQAAEDENAAEELPEPQQSELFERLRVVGTPDNQVRIPGSVTYLDNEKLEQQKYSDVHRILNQVPGVNVQEEEGYGLRPNIGLRGTGVERSSKITLLEDGVLIAPAPYAAPSAYYFPTVARMEGVEVRKGSAAIRQGPFTNGGAVNFISSSIPAEFGGTVNLALGEDDMQRGRARVGSSGERFGWLVEGFRMETDGFKQLDGGGATGFELEDFMGKFRVTSAPGADRFQALELKLGKTDQAGNETYLGLTDADFAANPFRRYAASRQDRIDTDHEQVQLRYFLRANDRVDLTATVYNNDFFRNWRKLEKVGGESVAGVLGDPDANADLLSILRADPGAAFDDPDLNRLNVRNNRREYYSRGAHAILGLRPGGTGSAHELEIGVRYHEDEEDRFQEEDVFAIAASGSMSLTAPGTPGSNANRVASAEALALFVEDRYTRGDWTVTPGVRFESIEMNRDNFGKADPTRSGADLVVVQNDYDEVIPGVGVNYRLSPTSSVFGGAHRGFAPPGPGADPATEPEESLNYEFGYRLVDGSTGVEVVGFFSDYDNLLGADTVSSGGAGEGEQFNGGEVEVRGLEASLRRELKPGDSSLTFPVSLTYTYTEAEFQTAFDSSFDPWGSVETGDELPYLPQNQASLGAGVVHTKASAFVNLTYVDDMRTVAGQGAIRADESTDSHFLVDLTGGYRIRPELEIYVQVRNLADEEYVAARRPAGVRPGMPRTVIAGVGFDF